MTSEYAILPASSGLIAASVTGTTAATANTLLTLTRQTTQVRLNSNLNQPVMVTLNVGNGAVDSQFLPAGISALLDIGSNKQFIPTGTVIGVYATDTGPTTGRIFAQVF